MTLDQATLTAPRRSLCQYSYFWSKEQPCLSTSIVASDIVLLEEPDIFCTRSIERMNATAEYGTIHPVAGYLAPHSIASTTFIPFRCILVGSSTFSAKHADFYIHIAKHKVEEKLALTIDYTSSIKTSLYTFM